MYKKAMLFILIATIFGMSKPRKPTPKINHLQTALKLGWLV